MHATHQGVRRPAAPTGRVALPRDYGAEQSRDHGAEWNLSPVRRNEIDKHKGTKGFNAEPQRGG